MRTKAVNQFGRAFFICLAILWAWPGQTMAETTWQFEGEIDGIPTYSRPVEGSDVKMYKATAMVEASMEQIGHLLRDVPATPLWMKNVLHTETIKVHTPNDIDLYLVLDFPWPTNDRDGVAAARAVFDPAACGTVTTTTLITHPDYPAKEGLVRLPGMFQQYLLNFKGDHLCELTLVLHMDPGGNLPAWAINRELVSTPAKSLKTLQALVKKDKYQEADDPFNRDNLGFSRGIARTVTARYMDDTAIIEMVAADTRLMHIIMRQCCSPGWEEDLITAILQAYFKTLPFAEKIARSSDQSVLAHLATDEKLAKEIAEEDDLVEMVLLHRGVTYPVLEKMAALVKDELD
ncbi:lipid-binding START domain protein [Desulfosudis oleivorans Hxd3]|uniref:Lipid-binding START domain protein n=2 Tax=Desulfosudis TaxID=2904716 RepID=A8ZZL0_DESOH|nr:lipid-binding START domain protein [Desulfosudis oleivorans Hxd3]